MRNIYIYIYIKLLQYIVFEKTREKYTAKIKIRQECTLK